MPKHTEISVVMTAHGKPERLALALAGVTGQKGVSFEHIVVADGASDDVLSEIKKGQRHSPIRLIETENKGRANARNIGAATAGSDIIVFLDDDILIENDFLVCHLDAQRRNPGLVKGKLREVVGLIKVQDPSQGGLGCKPIDIRELRGGMWSRLGIRTFANALEQAVEQEVCQHVPWIASAGANLSIPRQVWQDIGGFDSGFGVDWGLEDIDFGYAVHARGVPISFCADALGLHMTHGRPSRWKEQDRNWQRFLAKTADPCANALRYLLAPDGSAKRFSEAVDHIRQQG